jgi:hypothetical protein
MKKNRKAAPPPKVPYFVSTPSSKNDLLKKRIINLLKIFPFLPESKKNKMCMYNNNVIDSFVIWFRTYVCLSVYLNKSNFLKLETSNTNVNTVKENILKIKEYWKGKSYCCNSILYEIALREDWLEFL